MTTSACVETPVYGTISVVITLHCHTLVLFNLGKIKPLRPLVTPDVIALKDRVTKFLANQANTVLVISLLMVKSLIPRSLLS